MKSTEGSHGLEFQEDDPQGSVGSLLEGLSSAAGEKHAGFHGIHLAALPTLINRAPRYFLAASKSKANLTLHLSSCSLRCNVGVECFGSP